VNFEGFVGFVEGRLCDYVGDNVGFGDVDSLSLNYYVRLSCGHSSEFGHVLYFVFEGERALKLGTELK